MDFLFALTALPIVAVVFAVGYGASILFDKVIEWYNDVR